MCFCGTFSWVLTPAPRPAYLVQLSRTPIFETSPGKNDVNNRASFGKSHNKRGELCGKNHLDLRAIDG